MLIDRTVEFLKLWEKFEEKPYKDSAGIWTIGYGFTTYKEGLEVREFDAPMSMAEGETLLRHKLTEIADAWAETYLHWRSLNVFRKSAILSFSYNTGYMFHDGNHDTLDAALEKDLLAMPEIFMLYVKAAGVPLLGLQRRRMSEGALWNGCSPNAAYWACQGWLPEADEAITPKVDSHPPDDSPDPSKPLEAKAAKQKKSSAQKLDM